MVFFWEMRRAPGHGPLKRWSNFDVRFRYIKFRCTPETGCNLHPFQRRLPRKRSGLSLSCAIPFLRRGPGEADPPSGDFGDFDARLLGQCIGLYLLFRENPIAAALLGTVKRGIGPANQFAEGFA